jgi:hypothetical protein
MSKFLRRLSNSSEATLKKPVDTPVPPSTEITSTPPHQHESEKTEDERRENAYYWYKLLDKPKKGTMCRIVECTKGPDFTRQDIDLLPWNFRETKVSEDAMNSPKTKQKKKDKKLKKRDKKATERSGIEDTAVELEDNKKKDEKETESSYIEEPAFKLEIATVLNDCNERPTLQKGDLGESWRSLDFMHVDKANKVNGDKLRPTLPAKGRMGESWTSLNFSWNENGSSSSLDDASYDSWAQDVIRGEGDSEFDAAWLKAEATEAAEEAEEAAAAVANYDMMHSSFELAPRIKTEKKVKEEHERKRDERKRKMEAARAVRETKVEVKEKITVEDTPSDMQDARRERAFQWYARMASPNRREFKQKVAAQDWIDIKSEDVDLLPWNESGSAVSVAKMNAMVRAGMQRQ